MNYDAQKVTYQEATILTDRHCLQNAALTKLPCRRAYIATSCDMGMRIGVNR